MTALRPLPGWEAFESDGLPGYRRRELGVELVMAGAWGFMRCGPHASSKLMGRPDPISGRNGREDLVEKLLGARLQEMIADMTRSVADDWKRANVDPDRVAAHMTIIARAAQHLLRERDERQATGASPWS